MTPSPASTTPLVNGTSTSTPTPQQHSPGKMTTPTPKLTPTPKPTLTPIPTPTSTTAPIAAAAVPASVSTAPIKNGTVVSTTPQLPSPGQPKQSNAATPILKPPPSVARPRPQPFNPSPFTRHMSLRYRSNPLSFIPLRGDTSGYETLTEELSAPQLPPAVEALMLQNNTPASLGTPVLHPTVQPSSTPSEAGTMHNGLSGNLSSAAPPSSTLLNLSRRGNVPSQAAPLQPYAVPTASPVVNGPTHWGATGQQQQQAQVQPQRARNISDAEMWLASASADTSTSHGKTVQPNQGLLTTVNPFAETATQIDALSNAWTRDLQATLPTSSSSQSGNTSWSSSPWAQSSARTTTADDEFTSFFGSRQVSPPAKVPVSKKDSNPFKSPNQDQVFWV